MWEDSVLVITFSPRCRARGEVDELIADSGLLILALGGKKIYRATVYGRRARHRIARGFRILALSTRALPLPYR